jgi:hypothetical protein
MRTDEAEDPPPSNSAEDAVAVASEGEVIDLDTIDPTRFVRLLGKTSELTYVEDEAVEAITVVVYFHTDTDEEVSLTVEGQDIPALKSRDQEVAWKESEACTTTSAVVNPETTEVCRIEGSKWYRVRWTTILEGCTKTFTLRLSGTIFRSMMHIC